MSKLNNNSTPALALKFLSHGTLQSKDLEQSREFYEEFLGFEVVRTSDISLMIRLGGHHVYAVVEHKGADSELSFFNHNGIDVLTEAEVDESHRTCKEQEEKWGLKKISKPRVQHGTYSFYFWDRDGNAWEILCNPEGGYSWLFGEGDQEGKGHWSKDFERPEETQRS